MRAYLVPVIVIMLAIMGLLYGHHALDWFSISGSYELPVLA